MSFQSSSHRSFKSKKVVGVDLSACSQLVIKPESLTPTDAKKLSAALKSDNCTLKTLIIGRNSIGVVSVCSLLIFSHTYTGHKVYVYPIPCCVEQNGVRNLAHALERNDNLAELRLSVRIGDQAEQFASALEQNEHLKVLFFNLLLLPPLDGFLSSADLPFSYPFRCCWPVGDSVDSQPRER